VKATPRLVITPSSDTVFAAAVRAAAAELPAGLTPERARAELEQRLRQRYPGAVVRPREDLAGLGLSDEPVWYVTRRRYGSRIASKVEIAAPPELVFATYVERFAEWNVGMKIEATEWRPAIAGTRYSASFELFGRVLQGELRIVEADPPHSIRVEARGVGGIRVWYVADFIATATGTLVEVLGDFDLPRRVLPGSGVAFEQVIARQIERSHVSLRAMCEQMMSQATERVAES
jgi:hypothetical protein